jgi:hypothetical protein
MLNETTRALLLGQADEVKAAGLWKSERILTSRQGALVTWVFRPIPGC